MKKRRSFPAILILLAAMPLGAQVFTASGEAFKPYFLFNPMIGSSYFVSTMLGTRFYDGLPGSGPSILGYARLPSGVTPAQFIGNGDYANMGLSVTGASASIRKAMAAYGSPLFDYSYTGAGSPAGFSPYAVKYNDFVSWGDQYAYDLYKAGTLYSLYPWFQNDFPLASDLTSYYATATAAATSAFNSWYSDPARNFVDGTYGLITEKQGPRAAATLSYVKNALTTPVGFSFDRFNAISGGVLNYYKDAPEGADPTLIAFDLNNFDVGYWVKKNAELIDSGAFESYFEVELFRYWFNLEFWFPDLYDLFKWAESGRTALSLPQIVSGIGYNTSLARSSLLPGKADPNRKKEEGGAKALSEASGWILNANAPKTDFAFNLFELYGKQGRMLRSSSGYTYTSPQGLLSFGADVLVNDVLFDQLEDDYLSTSFVAKASINPIKSSWQQGTATLTAGASINEWILKANYLNSSLSYNHQFFLGDFYGAAGAMLAGAYWSQYPQLDEKLTLAGRVGYSFFDMFGLNLDAIYTRSLGSVWNGRWNAYTGDDLNLLNLGASADVYIGELFSVNVGYRRDFLMKSYSSWEVYLGGGLAF